MQNYCKNWNQFLKEQLTEIIKSKVTTQTQNHYADYLIGASFQRVNKFFALSFKDNAVRAALTGYFLTKVEMRNWNFIIDGRNLFDLPVKNDLRTYNNISKNK